MTKSTPRYKIDDTILHGVYKGFVVVAITNGWYTVYHPNNGPEATTKIRWGWATSPPFAANRQ